MIAALLERNMRPAETPDISGLIRAWANGDQTALDRLTPLVYVELCRIARRYMRHQRAGVTLQTTALVHEAYLHFDGCQEYAVAGPGSFFCRFGPDHAAYPDRRRTSTRVSEARRRCGTREPLHGSESG